MKQVNNTTIKLSLAAAVMMASAAPVAAATHEVDVAFLISQEVIDLHGREAVDKVIERQVSTYNRMMEEDNAYYGDLDLGIMHRVVYVEVMDAQLSQQLESEAEAQMSGAARWFDANREMFSYSSIQEQYGADKFSLIVSSQSGTTVGFALDNHLNILNYNHLVSAEFLYAHETGHNDLLLHTYSIDYANENSEECVTLMCPTGTWQNRKEFMFVREEAEIIALVKQGEYPTYPEYKTSGDFGAPTMGRITEAVERNGNISVAVDDFHLDVDAHEALLSIKVSLSQVFDQAVSIEVFTQGITAIPSEHYDSYIERVTFEPGETDKWINLSLYNPSSSDIALIVGARYGDIVNADAKVEVAVEGATTPGNGDDEGGSGGSSGFPLILALLFTAAYRVRSH